MLSTQLLVLNLLDFRSPSEQVHLSCSVLFCGLLYGNNGIWVSARLNEGKLQNILVKIMKWATSAWQGTAVFSLPTEKKGLMDLFVIEH